MATYPKKTGITNFDDCVYYLEEQIAQAAGGVLPSIDSGDNGKVLKINAGKWTKGNIPEELPAVTADNNGKILKVADGAWGIGSETVELPTMPTAAGTYRLKCVVADSVATLSWELQE